MTEEWSRPEPAVMADALDLLEEGRDAVLATVMSVEGNAYRRPGAKMVVTADGEGIGAVTAGCLEDEVLSLADDVLSAGRPRLETYDLTGEDDVWGLGLGCDGIIDLLVEPLDSRVRPALAAYDTGDPVGAITVLSGDLPTGLRGYYRPGEGFVPPPDGDPLPGWLTDRLADPAGRLLSAESAETVRIETDRGSTSVFVDGIVPPPELVVFGSGHDVGPVVELGSRAGFRVTVVGYRGATDLEERFPDADATITTSPGSVVGACDCGFGPRTYPVVMTHNFVDDRLTVEALLETDVEYVGLLGPRERFEEMLAEFEEEGVTFDAEDIDRVYTPAGLDLGAGDPYAIAVSIVAEALAVHNDRDPSHLRDREGPIHERIDLDVPAGED